MNNIDEPKKFYGTSIIIAFFCIILFVYTGQFLGINSANDIVEKRGIQIFPALDFSNPALTDQLDGYFRDNYGFRNIFLKFYIKLKLNYLKTKNIYNVFYNDQGFIFGELSPENDFKKAYEKIYFDQKELERIKSLLETEKAYFDKKKIPYLLVVIPDRRVVYNDQLPVTDNISILRHQHFIDYMKKNTSIDVLDLTPALINAKKDGYPLFFHTDTHWTNYGAFIGYQAVMNHLKKYNNNIDPLVKEDFDISIEKYDLWTGDGGLIYPENPGHPEYNVFFKLKNEALSKYKKLGPLLGYGDSFAFSDRRICKYCYEGEFPDFAPLITTLFERPNNELVDDSNPDYWRAKYKLEDMIPFIRQNISDVKTQNNIIGYLMRDNILAQPVGLDFFLAMSFSKVTNEDLKKPINFSMADSYGPEYVIREVVDNRIWELGR